MEEYPVNLRPYVLLALAAASCAAAFSEAIFAA